MYDQESGHTKSRTRRATVLFQVILGSTGRPIKPECGVPGAGGSVVGGDRFSAVRRTGGEWRKERRSHGTPRPRTRIRGSESRARAHMRSSFVLSRDVAGTADSARLSVPWPQSPRGFVPAGGCIGREDRLGFRHETHAEAAGSGFDGPRRRHELGSTRTCWCPGAAESPAFRGLLHGLPEDYSVPRREARAPCQGRSFRVKEYLAGRGIPVRMQA